MHGDESDKIKIHRDIFTIERHFAHRVDVVYSAWAAASAKKSWFSDSEQWQSHEYRLDFRDGGSEYDRAVVKGSGMEIIYDAHYLKCLSNQIIVYSYNTIINQRHLSSSLSTVEFFRLNDDTRLLITENVVAFDRPDNKEERTQGWNSILAALNNYLQSTESSRSSYNDQ